VEKLKNRLFLKAISLFVTLTFLFSPNYSYAAALPYMPQAGTMIGLTEGFSIPQPLGMVIDPKNPLKFTFIIDQGNYPLRTDVLRAEAEKMGRYFMAALAIPEKDLWVNLSPYEPERICMDALAATDLGKDMLGEDYVLKQLASSLTCPETEAGKAYWGAINNLNRSLSEPRPSIRSANGRNTQGAARIETTQSFNKIWIVPGKITVYEGNNRVVIGDAGLKVMMEEDYLAMQKNSVGANNHSPAGQAFKTHILPLIEQEINQGKHFAQFRQVYRSVILAQWLKKKLKDTILSQAYFNSNKIKGVEALDPAMREKIYNEYVAAFKQGAYNYVKSDRVGANNYSPVKKITKRQYFSGGATLETVSADTEVRPIAEALPQLQAQADNSPQAVLAMEPIDSTHTDRQLALLDAAMPPNVMRDPDPFKAKSVGFLPEEETAAIAEASVVVMRIALSHERHVKDTLASQIEKLQQRLATEQDAGQIARIRKEIEGIQGDIAGYTAIIEHYRAHSGEIAQTLIAAIKNRGVDFAEDPAFAAIPQWGSYLQTLGRNIFLTAVDPVRRLKPLQEGSELYRDIYPRVLRAMSDLVDASGIVQVELVSSRAPLKSDVIAKNLTVAIIECVNNHRHHLNLREVLDGLSDDPYHDSMKINYGVTLIIEAVYAHLLAVDISGDPTMRARFKQVAAMIERWGDFGKNYALKLLADFDGLGREIAGFVVGYMADGHYDPSYRVVYTHSDVARAIYYGGDKIELCQNWAVDAGWRVHYSPEFYILTEAVNRQLGILPGDKGCFRRSLAQTVVSHLMMDISPASLKDLRRQINDSCQMFGIGNMPPEDFIALIAAVYPEVVQARTKIRHGLEIYQGVQGRLEKSLLPPVPQSQFHSRVWGETTRPMSGDEPIEPSNLFNQHVDACRKELAAAQAENAGDLFKRRKLIQEAARNLYRALDSLKSLETGGPINPYDFPFGPFLKILRDIPLESIDRDHYAMVLSLRVFFMTGEVPERELWLDRWIIDADFPDEMRPRLPPAMRALLLARIIGRDYAPDELDKIFENAGTLHSRGYKELRLRVLNGTYFDEVLGSKGWRTCVVPLALRKGAPSPDSEAVPLRAVAGGSASADQPDGGLDLNNLSGNIETRKNGKGVEIDSRALAAQLKNITGLTPVVIDVVLPVSRRK